MTDVVNAKQRETILTKVPAARLGTPDEIAAAAVFLASNEAGYVTGQTIHVNGGMAMILATRSSPPICGETPFVRVIRGLWPRHLNYDNRTRDLDGQRTPLQDFETLY